MHGFWPGVDDREHAAASQLQARARLADAARAGAWDAMLHLLATDHSLSPNQWRLGGRSWYAPLHQAAWHGAPVEVVHALIERGAWRSLRARDGARPVEIARRRGHRQLVEALAAPELEPAVRRAHDAMDAHLAQLVAARTERLPPVAMRPLPTELLALEGLDALGFAIPAMFGGFVVTLHRGRVFVESRCRVVAGSAQAHVITARGCVLVDEGWV